MARYIANRDQQTPKGKERWRNNVRLYGWTFCEELTMGVNSCMVAHCYNQHSWPTRSQNAATKSMWAPASEILTRSNETGSRCWGGQSFQHEKNCCDQYIVQKNSLQSATFHDSITPRNVYSTRHLRPPRSCTTSFHLQLYCFSVGRARPHIGCSRIQNLGGQQQWCPWRRKKSPRQQEEDSCTTKQYARMLLPYKLFSTSRERKTYGNVAILEKGYACQQILRFCALAIARELTQQWITIKKLQQNQMKWEIVVKRHFSSGYAIENILAIPH